MCSRICKHRKNVNFMATYGKGLICMPMSREFTQKAWIRADGK